jgi:hypothetical protein
VAVTKINPRLTPRPAPVRTIEVVLDGDHAGWCAQMRTSGLKYGVLMDIAGEDEAVRLAALGSIFIEWNWVNEDGDPLPQPRDGGMREADSDAIKAALIAWQDQLGKQSALPKA